MTIGKYLSLEEARNSDQVKRFCKEHETKGSKKEFDRILDSMVQPIKKPKSNGRTLKKG